MSATLRSRGNPSSRAGLKPHLPLKVPTEAEIAREIGTVVGAMLAIAFAVNLALAVFGAD